jgi:hypothetical protein
VLQAVQSNSKLVAWHRCRRQGAPLVATAAALAMAEQQGSQDIDADSIITAQVRGALCPKPLHVLQAVLHCLYLVNPCLWWGCQLRNEASLHR